jgi:hypothetical protein
MGGELGVFEECGDEQDTRMFTCYENYQLTETEKSYNAWRNVSVGSCPKSLALCKSTTDCNNDWLKYNGSSDIHETSKDQLGKEHTDCETCTASIVARDNVLPNADNFEAVCKRANEDCAAYGSDSKFKGGNYEDCANYRDLDSEALENNEAQETEDECKDSIAWDTCKNSENCKPFRDCLAALPAGDVVDSTTCQTTDDSSPIECHSDCKNLVEIGCKNALLDANDNSGAGNVAAGFAAAITAVVALFIA